MNTDDKIAAGFLVGLVVILLTALASCGGPNQAYLQDNWPRFQRECLTFCAPGESQPTRVTRPWLCGCVPIGGHNE